MKFPIYKILMTGYILSCQTASSIDFKIDLPPIPRVLQKNQNAKPLQKKNKQSHTTTSLFTPTTEMFSGKTLLPQGMSLPFDEKSFPTYSCLQDSFNFWAQVYRDIDTNSLIFHDRHDTSKIYGIITTSGTSKDMKETQDHFREQVKTQLNKLARLIHHPHLWTSDLKKIALMFPGKELTIENLKKAQNQIRAQRGLKSTFNTAIRRSFRYLPFITKTLKKHNLPLDIMYLPFVESSYNPNALSKVGAAGMWQIMPATMGGIMGKRYIRKRKDYKISSIAASRILRQNYQHVPVWPLALTAYNHGLGGIKRAVRQTKSKDLCTIIDRYESQSFKFASTHFYAQFIAARKVAYEKYAELLIHNRAPSHFKQVAKDISRYHLQ